MMAFSASLLYNEEAGDTPPLSCTCERKVFDMLAKINEKEIMTAYEAAEKYEDKYFFMVITDIVDRADNDLGYVIYTADTELELSKAPLDEYAGLMVGSMTGGGAEPFPSFGGLEVVHYG